VDFYGSQLAPRSVVFHVTSTGKAEYLNPLSCLYEPLVYPLWYPCGGREWGPDLNTRGQGGCTQLWWYRQQLLRLPHMGYCGRVLHEWLVNMHRHVEHERLSLWRRGQQSRIATRSQLCEAIANTSKPPQMWAINKICLPVM
jgi:hypothetical protein